MGIIQAFSGAIGGTLADQWKDIITAGHFTEYTVVAPGVFQQTNNGRGANYKGSADIISNGSKIFVPENTAAFIFSQAGIEEVVTESGGYEYLAGQPSVFNGDGFSASIVKQTAERVGFGGQTSDQKYLAFVNLREIRGIKFGTRGPMVYNDRFYGADLELLAYGTFSLQVVDAVSFVRNFLPANARYYSFETPEARQQISSEFIQAFIAVVNSLSSTHRISELPSQTGALAELIADDGSALGSWIERFGLDAKVIAAALAPPPSEEQRADALDRFDPIDLLVPEWKYLQQQPSGSHHNDPSGLTLSPRNRGLKLPSKISRVLAVDKLRKVNAVVGFTRIDEMERVGDLGARLAPLSRDRKPLWTVATEDRGEGIYLQLDEMAVAEWEEKVLASTLWKAHLESHRRNFANRFSETALVVDPDVRLPAPRYWLLHTLSHVLIREMAMQAGYSAASISERLYAWPGSKDRPAAAGLLLLTTASDSDGTLGGLVQLSEPARLESLVNTSLDRAHRCSSDPVCAYRTPKDPEDFLHGAACHCCAMASETSCERANRFLDRRFLVNLPGGGGLGFFG